MSLDMLMFYTPYLALLLRVVVGASLVMHGYPKLKNPQATLKWTGGLSVPAAATVAVIVLEFFGGIALILGFLVPIVAFFIALEMIGNIALKKTKIKAPYLIGENAAAYETDALYILLAVTMIVLGAGAFSLSAPLGI
ncbi:MAG: DoxX family protein [Candidatus Bathyarchaeia archaeon]|jgi:putative oxidoreductase